MIHSILIRVQVLCAHPSLEKGFPKHRSDLKALVWNSTPWYTLIFTNFRVIPASDWMVCLKHKTPRIITPQPPLKCPHEHWTAPTTHTHLAQVICPDTRQSKEVIQGELALLPHIIGGIVFWLGEKWGWKEVGSTWLISSLSDSSMLSLFASSLSASTITRAALHKLMTSICSDSTVTSHQ